MLTFSYHLKETDHDSVDKEQTDNDMTKELLLGIKSKLEDLFANYYSAQRTKDGRSREKNIREAKQAISDYSQSIPTEVMEYFYREVGANALNCQHADDLPECINVLDRMIKEQYD